MKVLIENLKENVLDIIQNKKEDWVYSIPEKTNVLVGNDSNFNYKYCIENNIPIVNLSYSGGVIVAETGDIDCGIFKRDGWNLGVEFLNLIVEFIKTKTNLNVEINGNDVLIDNQYKVCSFGSCNLGDNIIFTAIHINLNADLEKIKSICQKEMVKIPKGLSEFGINTEEIENLFLDFTNKLK